MSSHSQRFFQNHDMRIRLYAAHTGGLLVKWATNMFNELNIPIKLPITFNLDNMSTIQLNTNGDFMRTKHIQKRFFSLKNLQDRGIIKQQYCQTKDMKANLFTKSHSYARFSRLRNIIIHLQDWTLKPERTRWQRLDSTRDCWKSKLN